jgi:predicted RNA methylase
VVGVDIDDASVETARQRAATAALANVEFVTADVASADLDRASMRWSGGWC